MNNNQKGLTVFEVGVTLAAIGIITAAIFSVASGMFMGSKSEKLFDDVTQLEKTIRSVYQNQRNYANLTAQRLVDADLVNDSMIASNGSLSTRFGNVSIFPVDQECVGCSDGFLIELRRIPSEVCIKLASREYGSRMDRLLVSPEAPNNMVEVSGNPGLISSQCRISDEARVRMEFKG